YLQFLDDEAKQGTLQGEDLPLFGWPAKRVKGWWRKVWPCAWVGKASDLLEPFFFLPCLLISAWMFVLLQPRFALSAGVLAVLSMILTMVIISVLCLVWVWWQQKDDK